MRDILRKILLDLVKHLVHEGNLVRAQDTALRMRRDLAYLVEFLDPFRVCPLVVFVSSIQRDHVFDQAPIIVVTDLDIADQIKLRFFLALTVLSFPIGRALLADVERNALRPPRFVLRTVMLLQRPDDVVKEPPVYLRHLRGRFLPYPLHHGTLGTLAALQV